MDEETKIWTLKLPSGEKKFSAPLSWTRDQVVAAARKRFAPAPALTPPTGPLTPEEQAQPTMTAGEPGASSGEAAAKVAMHGAGFSLPEAGAAALDAAVNPEGSHKTFGERFREGKNIADQQETDAESKVAHPALLGLAGAVASPITKLLGPLSKLAERGSRGVKALAGLTDAVGTSAGLAAAENLDKPGEAAKQAAESPWNALGAAAPAFSKAAETIGNGLRSRAAKRAFRALNPSSEDVGELYRTFGQLFGEGASAPTASEWIRDARLGDGTPIMQGKAEEIYNKLRMKLNDTGQQKQMITELAHNSGAAVDTDSLKKQINEIYTKYNTPENRAADPAGVQRLSEQVGRLMDLIESGSKNTGNTKVPGTIVNGQPVQNPTVIGNAYNPRMQDLTRWEKTKTALQNALDDSFKSSDVSTIRDRGGKEIASAIRTADDTAVGEALGPDAADAFAKVKDEYGKTQVMTKIAEEARNSAGAEKPKSLLDKFKYAIASGTLGGAGSYAAGGAHVNPAVVAGSAALGAGVDAWGRANPTAARTYDALGRGVLKARDATPQPDPQDVQALVQYLRGGTQ